jgi:Secretion system C-terminal sorting domain
MKKQVLVVLALVAAFATQAQLVNGGFENWTTVSVVSNPDGWLSSNSTSTPQAVTPASPGHSGQKCAKLSAAGGSQNPGGVAQYISAAGQDISTISYYLKGSFSATDSIIVGAVSMAADSSILSIASGLYVGSQVTSAWTMKTETAINIASGTPAILEVIILVSGNAGSTGYAEVDDVNLSTVTAVVEQNPSASNMIQQAFITDHSLQLNLNDNVHGLVTLDVMSLTGVRVYSQQFAASTSERFDLSQLSSGIYIVQVGQGNRREVRKVYIER